MTFNNNASMVGFFPQGVSVEEVIAKDTKELEEVGGSFEAIASRMEEIVRFAEENSRNLPETMDDKVRVIFYIATRGMQLCPYEGCDNEGQRIIGWR